MPSEKDRLYVVLHARAGQPKMPGLEDKYHWSLMCGPKNETLQSPGYRWHAKTSVSFVEGKPQSTWSFEEKEVEMIPSRMQLVRVVIGKIRDAARVRRILQEQVPVRGETEGWNCVSWAQEAFETLRHDGKALGTCAGGWPEVRDAAMWYVAEKAAAHRYDGQVPVDSTKAATWDMLTGVELIE